MVSALYIGMAILISAGIVFVVPVRAKAQATGFAVGGKGIRPGKDSTITGQDSSRRYTGQAGSIPGFAGRGGENMAEDSTFSKNGPATGEYMVLQMALDRALQSGQQDTIALLRKSLESYLEIYRHHYPKCVVVNIASGTLHYYERDSLALEMKVVTGRPATPTPRFMAFCDEVILYPYWNVPRSIAVNEFLPLCKRSTAILSFMNIQVLDRKGTVLDPGKINWKQYSKNNFPYRFRQGTGCDNALGVIKFNLKSPYGVYLHDTNNKTAFASEKRYFSHGCIRLEKPVELAGLLLETALDTRFLEACIKNEKPQTLSLPQPVPVYVLYLRAYVENGREVVYYEDIYNLGSR
jgi:murein L,D-transpeptidase YcbB/YkuD